MHYDTQAVIAFVTQLGYNVLTSTEATQQTDAEIWFTAEMSVQVCTFGGLAVNVYEGTGADFSMRQWDVGLLSGLPDALATAEAFLPAPVKLEGVDASTLDAAARRLLDAHQALDEDERREALAHLRAVVGALS